MHRMLQRDLDLLGPGAQQGAAQTAAWVHPAALQHPCSQACHGQGIECMYVYFCSEKPDRKRASPVYRDCRTVKMMGKHNGCSCCWFPFVFCSSLLKSLVYFSSGLFLPTHLAYWYVSEWYISVTAKCKKGMPCDLLPWHYK